MREESLKQFGALLVSLSRITADVADAFFAERIHADMIRISQAYTRLLPQGDNVAQYSTLWEIKLACESCIATLEYATYSQVAALTPLARARKAVYNFYHEVLRHGKGFRGKAVKITEGKKESKIISSKSSRVPSLTHNQKKILMFIRSFPNARTKDIIDEFKMLSGRTVKRNLRELMAAGLVTKRSEQKAVYYSTAASQS